MRKILSTLAALMSASFFVHGSNAAITTMIALTIAESGGSQSDVSTIASSYFLGFLIGCFFLTNQILRVGLIRAFTAASAVVTISIIALDVLDGVWVWALLRFTMGAAMAAVLAVADTWINSKTPNEQRGGVIAVYATLMGAASLVGQIVFLVFDASADGFVLMFAISTNFAVVLVAMTTGFAPAMETRSGNAGFNFVITSKTAATCAFTAGLMTSSIVSVVPFYQTSHGVEEDLVAITMIALFLGRLLFMWPAGHLSDRFDRRTILIGLSSIVAVIGVFVIFVGAQEGRILGGDAGRLAQASTLLLVVLLGGALYPIFSAASSLAFDRAEGQQLVDVSTTNLALNSAGSVSGPLLVSMVTALVGDAALFVVVVAAATLNVVVSLVRRVAVVTPGEVTPASAALQESSVGMAQAAAELVEEEMESSDE